ncbi:phage tail family protein [Anaerobacillus sp. CMMVII]|uniref:phage tail family protein n=1 Tax=Anaerobacillus sp. CMMVII TaxID=2755588 RepID=UPI0021B7D170|nr:phage tail family protein [Anaerobacillus sp. CMMVII]MCT8138648.1 phage tail family protein [Anaerobacillus sp. CMMVII]
MTYVAINDFKMNDLLDVRLNVDAPGLSSTRDRIVVIPGRHGAIDFGADLSEGYHPIPCDIRKRNMTEVQNVVRELNQLLLDPYGNPKTVKLRYGFEPDKFYFVRYSGELPISRLAVKGSFTLPFVAYDPNAKFVVSTEEITWDSDVPFMSDVTLGSDYEFDINSNQTIVIHNFGTMVVKPTVVIEGSATSLALSLNGESFSFGSFSNSTIEIVSEKFNVYKDGDYQFSLMEGNIDKLILMPGTNDVIVSGSNLNIKITFKFHAKYL